MAPPLAMTGACAGLGGIPLGEAGFVDTTTRPWAIPAPTPGEMPSSAVPDVCLEVDGLQGGWFHELAVRAGNNNVDLSPPSSTILLVPRPPPVASPAGPLLVLEQGPSSAVLFWPPPAVEAGLAPAAQFPSGEFFQVKGRVLGQTAWSTLATFPPLAVEYSGTLVQVRGGGSVLVLDPSQVPTADGALSGLCLSVAVAGGVDGLPGGFGESSGGWETRRIVAYWANGTAQLDSAIAPPPAIGATYAVSLGYAITGLLRGAGYEFAVYAGNAAGPAELPPLRGVVPTPPRDVRISRLVPGGALELSWTWPTQASCFAVDAATGPAGAFLSAAIGVSSVPVVLTAMNLTLPTPGSSLEFLVRSCGAAAGPCERVGAAVQAFAAAGPAAGLVNSWVSSKTRGSFVVQCTVNYTTAPPMYFVVMVCNDAACDGVGDSFYPYVPCLKTLLLRYALLAS